MKVVALFAASLWAAACTKPDPYEQALIQIDDRNPERRDRALSVIVKHWEKIAPLAPIGTGPRQLGPQDLALREKLLDLLGTHDFSGARASLILVHMRAPGFDERLFRCAATLHNYERSNCLDAIFIVADDAMLRSLVPLLDNRKDYVGFLLQKLGRKSVSHFGHAIRTGSANACSVALFYLRRFLAHDEEEVDKAILADPRLVPETIVAVRGGLVHPGWRCRTETVRMIVEYDVEHRAELIAPLANDPSPAVREAVQAGLEGRVAELKPYEYDEPANTER